MDALVSPTCRVSAHPRRPHPCLMSASCSLSLAVVQTTSADTWPKMTPSPILSDSTTNWTAETFPPWRQTPTFHRGRDAARPIYNLRKAEKTPRRTGTNCTPRPNHVHPCVATAVARKCSHGPRVEPGVIGQTGKDVFSLSLGYFYIFRNFVKMFFYSLVSLIVYFVSILNLIYCFGVCTINLPFWHLTTNKTTLTVILLTWNLYNTKIKINMI